jgi:Flp pilus assembly protein TadG
VQRHVVRRIGRIGRPRHRTAEGQAAVELALAFPLVCIFLLGVVQVTLVARDAIAVVHSAREGARAAAVAASPASAAANAVLRAGGLEPGRLTSLTMVSGDTVRVTVRYRAPTDVPLVGALVPDVALSATATMALEP